MTRVRKWKCAVCRQLDEAGNGAWACHADLDTTPVHRGKCFEAYQRQKIGYVAPAVEVSPVPMRLTCPSCGELHIDEGDFSTRVHHTHACQHCGMVWRPAIVATVGVRFLPGFKNTIPCSANVMPPASKVK